MSKLVKPTKQLRGTLYPPADKSISHRAAILNSLASGEAIIENFSDGYDCNSTLECLNLLGVTTDKIHSINGDTETTTLSIKSPGLQNFMEPENVMDCGNSGTTMRFIMGLLAAVPFMATVNGDASLRSRPMGRIVKPLSLMGAHIIGRSANSLAPLAIKGTQLKGINYELPVASAQLKSSLLIAGIHADSETTLHQPALSRDHTERMLTAMGANISNDGFDITVTPNKSLRQVNMTVPGDVSAASFWIIAAAAHSDADITLSNVGMNQSRTAVINILKDMGANITIDNERTQGGEPTADLLVHSSTLEGVRIAGDVIPIVQDEIPILALAACFAKGVTHIEDAQELRYKESDRLAATAAELTKLGANISETQNGLIIKGGGALRGGYCESHDDHRLAMTLGIAGLLAQDKVVIERPEVVNISYPNFWEDMALLSHP